MQGKKQSLSTKDKIISIRNWRNAYGNMEFLVEKLGPNNKLFEQWYPIHKLYNKMHMVATFLKSSRASDRSNMRNQNLNLIE